MHAPEPRGARRLALGAQHVDPGLEDGLALFELIEDLGYRTGYVRSRHLQPFLSTPLPFLAAAGQRVRRLLLGTQVIPLRFENAGRLAEEIATTDLLTQGRLRIGVSSGYSAQDAVNMRAFGETRGTVREHVDRTLHDLLSFLEGEPVAMADTHIETIEPGTPLRVQPQVPGLRDRLDEIPTDQPVYVHCRSAQRSYNMVRALHQLGRPNAVNISGSYLGISENEYFTDQATGREPIVTEYNFS